MRGGGQKGHYSSCQGHGPDIVDHGGEGLEDVEGADNQNGQKQGLFTELCIIYQRAPLLTAF